jgi:hypothetical protein
LEALEDNIYSIEIHIATFEDILIHCAADPTQSIRQRLHIRRRDAEGFYHLIHDIDNDLGSYTPITNGKWLALVGRSGAFLMGRLDSDFNFVNVTIPGINARAGGFYRNDTFTVHNWKDNTLRTIEYVNDEWVQIDSVALTGTLVSEIGQSTIIGDYFLIAESSETLVLRIYGRQANGSWAVVDLIPDVGDITLGVTLYDGVDSVVMASSSPNTESGIPDAQGLLTIYKKTSGQWAVQQQFTLLDLGVTSAGNAGRAMAMPDRNTILYGVPITANLSDSTPSYPLGKVFVIKRNETGLWSVTGTLYTNEKITFANRVFTNDYDHIILGSTDLGSSITLFSIPKCYDSPINVTCASMDLDNECAFDTSSLHTINNPQCGPVDAKLKTVGATSGNEISVDFEFSRYATTATCTAQITCPAAPFAGSAPVASTPSRKTSDTWCINSSYFGVTMLLLLTSMIF